MFRNQNDLQNRDQASVFALPDYGVTFFQAAAVTDSYSVEVDINTGITVTVMTGKFQKADDMIAHIDHFCQQLGDWGYFTENNRPIIIYKTSEFGARPANCGLMAYDGNVVQDNPVIKAVTFTGKSFIFTFTSDVSQEKLSQLNDKFNSMKGNPKLNITSVDGARAQVRPE